MTATFANPETGELEDARPIKDVAVDAATQLVETVWSEVKEQYNVAPLTALKITEKIVNAVLSGSVKEHVEILAEPLKPKQTRMAGLD